MPLPPRQPYAFASSNPSAASSSQHQVYNRYQQQQQQQRQPPNAPRRGYTAAPGAASAVSLLPPGQRDAGSDSVHSNPFNAQARGPAHTISDKFSLSPDPSSWGADLSPNHPEADDYLHTPDKKGVDDTGSICSMRGIANLGCILILATAIVGLFGGYPILSHFLTKPLTNLGAFNLGGINATGQVMQTMFALIDPDTPANAQTHKSVEDGRDWQLVFSDEFNVEGRTFYPGDDPFWEASDLHYWGTNNLEWYDPQQSITRGGNLEITLDKVKNHGLDYMGGLISTWNKFCFTGGLVVASVVLPGRSDVYGLWPAIWTMGNLGRAGYGASLDGMWPYTYEACDLGTLPNQTFQGGPPLALTSGDQNFGGGLSYLIGQKLSSCTCPGEAHPGPILSDGSYLGRAAPEIDMFEAQVSQDTRIGHVSQSGQWAPFDAFYSWNNASYLTIKDPTISELNTYRGSVYQQTTSVVSKTNQDCYYGNTGCFSVYGFEYKEGYEKDNAYISWINDGEYVWRVGAGGVAANELSQISARPVPKEPMYLIMNLGLSLNFGAIDFDNLVFPTKMLVDYVRVYQHPDRINIGCDPPGYPTNNYINAFIEAYTNPNLTTWEDDYKQSMPRNKLLGQC